MKVVLATQNQQKIHEFRDAFPFLDIVQLSDFTTESPEETGVTYVENALIKARHASQLTGLPAIADDSGMEIPWLLNAPGVYSARYAGENATFQANNAKVVSQLQNANIKETPAIYRCLLVFIRGYDDPAPLISEGILKGKFTVAEGRVPNGFGYDVHFHIPEKYVWLSELSKTERANLPTHRKAAIDSLTAKLKSVIAFPV